MRQIWSELNLFLLPPLPQQKTASLISPLLLLSSGVTGEFGVPLQRGVNWGLKRGHSTREAAE